MERRRDDYKYLEIRDAMSAVNQKVSIVGVVLEFGLPKRTRGTDWFCSLKVVDESLPKIGIPVNVFAPSADKLPRIAAPGDIILLSYVTMKAHNGEIYAVYNKKFSSFALYEGKDGESFVPYQSSSRFYPRRQDSKLIAGLRKWLVDFRIDEGSKSFLSLRELRQGEHANLVCKVLHMCEVAKNDWMVFVWDGTDCPPTTIDAKWEDEMDNQLPLQLELMPLPRDVLCTFPPVGTILRIIIEKGQEKNFLHLLNTGRWVKFLNIRCEVHAGLWHGMLTPFTHVRGIPNDSHHMVECQRAYDERLSLQFGRIPYWCFPWCSRITEVDFDHVPFVTLMDVLTHGKVTAKFKCIVRVLATFPWHAEDFLSCHGIYRIRLTIEDPTARIHAFLYAEDVEKFFGGHPSVDVLTSKRNTLLGVAVNNEGEETVNAPRNPPWVQCCLKSYYLDKNNPWRSRCYRIFGTTHVG